MAEEQVQASAPQAADNPSAQSQVSVDWEARFKGLSAKYNADQQQWSKREQAFISAATENEGLRQSVAQREKELQDYKANMEKSVREYEEFKGASAKVQAKLDRLNAIASFDPALLAFDQKGLLRPDLTGDEFMAHLKAFKETLSGAGVANIRQEAAGVSPTPPAQSVGDSPEALFDQIQKAMAKGDWEQVEALNQRYADLAYKGR